MKVCESKLEGHNIRCILKLGSVLRSYGSEIVLKRGFRRSERFHDHLLPCPSARAQANFVDWRKPCEECLVHLIAGSGVEAGKAAD